MNVIKTHKELAQQWKATMNQDFSNGLKKEHRVKLRLWATYIERVVSAKSPTFYELIKLLASMNVNGKMFAPFDKPPNDREHSGQYLESLGKKLHNLGLIKDVAEESLFEPLSLNELNVLQKVIDPAGARELASKQSELKKSSDGKTKTTSIKLMRVKTM